MTSPSLPPGYELRGANESEIPDVVRFAESVFRMPREFFLARYRNYPGARPEHSRIVMHNGQPVAHHRLYQHPFGFAGGVVSAWAIGDVCTHPAHRRMGLGRALLQDSSDYVRVHGGCLCLIQAGFFDFYCSCGWESLALPSLRVDVATFPMDAFACEGYVTRTFEEHCDLWQVADVHRRFNAGRSLVRQRDRSFWANRRLWCPQEKGLGFVVAEQQGQVVAYGRLWQEHLSELCYLPGHEAGALAVLSALLRLARAEEGKAIRGTLPKDHVVWQALAAVPGVQFNQDRDTLLRLVSLRALLEQTLDALSARLRTAGVALSAPLTIRCAGEEVTLVPKPGYLAVADGARSGRAVELSQHQLLELGAGLASPVHVLGDRVDKVTLAELAALFPLGNPIYWNTDAV